MVLKGRRPSRARLTGSVYVYLLRCRDRTFYTGWTTDLDRRVARHQAGTAARHTRSRLPGEVVYVERLQDRREAARGARTLRRLSLEEEAGLAGRDRRLRTRQAGETKGGVGWPA